MKPKEALLRLNGIKEVPILDGTIGGRAAHSQWWKRAWNVLREAIGPESPLVEEFAAIEYEGGEIAGRVGAARAGRVIAKAIQIARARIGDPQLPTMRQESGDSNIPPTGGRCVPTRRVFIVHGHDHGLKNAVARHIEALGLEHVILHEEPDRSQTIIEKFEAVGTVDFAVVLLTADDLGIAKSVHSMEPIGPNVSAPMIAKEQLNRRARQNVVFELGYFVGKLGRQRVALIADPHVEIPSDFSGVIRIDRADWTNRLFAALDDVGYRFPQDRIRRALEIRG